jgi:CSLREA domain-containing protein
MRKTVLVGIPTTLAALVTVVVLAAGLVAPPAHADTTFTVNTTGDENDLDFPGGTYDSTSDGLRDVDAATGEQCTLRAAIQEANVTQGPDTINFNIPGTGVKTIRPDSELPSITEQVTIDGYTQPGSQLNSLASGDDAVLKVELDGTNAGVVGGLDLLDSTSNSMIRGLVINDFYKEGIHLLSTGTRIEGNFIGTNPSGTEKKGNFDGVSVGKTRTNNFVGGTSPEVRNIISGNGENSVVLGIGSSGTKVWGNYIGTNKEGTKPLANSVRGVWIFGSSDNTIGGVSKAEKANKIAFNGSNGVTIQEYTFGDVPANGNRVVRNSIFANGELGIDLGGDDPTLDGDGPTPNDNKDRDDGPNTLQNKPRLTSATTTGTKIIMQGTLRSTPNENFTIRFFANRASEPRGYEGRTYLGLKSVSTDANGEVSFSKALSAKVNAGQRITATATGPGRNTSEFSIPEKVVQQ